MRAWRISIVSISPSSRTTTFWKRRSSAGSPSTHFSYSLLVVAPMTRKSPRTSAGLSMLAASIADADRRALPDQIVQLVDEQDDVGRRRSFRRRCSANALLVLAAIRRAGEQRDVIERQQAHVAHDQRHVLGGDALGEPLGDCRLADTGRSDERRIVLPVAKQDVDDARDFRFATAHRLEASRTCVRGQVAREARERTAGLVSKQITNHGGCGNRGEAGRGRRVTVSPRPAPLPLATRAGASPQNNVSSAAGARNTPNGTSGVSNGGVTERELGLLARLASPQQRDGNHDGGERDRAERRAKEDGDQCARRTERGTDERHQRHVAEPHRFALRHHFAKPSDDRDHPCASTRSD